MGLYDAFFGSPQALYASYAIAAAIITIVLTIILTRTDLTVGNRVLFVFLVVLMLIPSIFLTLLQLTCMVTGGNKNQRWWCWLYAWIVCIFIIIYCIFVIIISFMTLFTYSNAMDKVNIQEKMTVMSPQDSNEYAHNMMVETFVSEKMAKPDVKKVEVKEVKEDKKEENKEEEDKKKKEKFENTSESVSVKSSQSQLNQLLDGEDELEGFSNRYSKY